MSLILKQGAQDTKQKLYTQIEMLYYVNQNQFRYCWFFFCLTTALIAKQNF